MPAKSLDRWLVNDALDGDSPWATPKSGTDAAKIKQIADYITHGNRPEADRLIAEIDRFGIVETDVRSELLFQLGRRASLQGDFVTAYEKFKEAAALRPASSRHFVAELETAVLARLGQEPIVPAIFWIDCRSSSRIQRSDSNSYEFMRLRTITRRPSGCFPRWKESIATRQLAFTR